MNNLLLLDTRFESPTTEPNGYISVATRGFRLSYEHRATGRTVDYEYEIIFFLADTERGLIPTSAIVHAVHFFNQGNHQIATGCFVLDPEPIIHFFNITEFDEWVDEARQNFDDETPSPPSLHDDIISGSLNLNPENADVFLAGIAMLLDFINDTT